MLLSSIHETVSSCDTDSPEVLWAALVILPHLRPDKVRMTDWVIEWLIDGLSEWLSDQLTEWLIEWLNDWLIDLLIDWLIDLMINGLVSWLIGRSIRHLAGRLFSHSLLLVCLCTARNIQCKYLCKWLSILCRLKYWARSTLCSGNVLITCHLCLSWVWSLLRLHRTYCG